MLAHSLHLEELPPRDELDEYVREIRPYGDVLIVEVEPDEFETSGLLVRHVNGEQSPVRIGRVLAVGSGRRGKNGGRIPSPYAVGDRVCFGRGEAYVKTKIAGREVRFLREEQLEGVAIDTDARVAARYVD